MPRPGMERAGCLGPAGGLKMWEPQVQEVDLGWTAEMGEIDYSNLFNGMEQGVYYGSENAVSSA